MIHTSAPNPLISKFVNKPFLSDINLKLPFSAKNINAHKVIIAAGSAYFYSLFESDSTLSETNVPRPIQTQYPNTDDGFTIVLEYLYANQVILKRI